MATSSAIPVGVLPFQSYALWTDTWKCSDGRYRLNGIQRLASFTTTLDLRQALSAVQVPDGGSLHVFKDGITPLYAHAKNVAGGHFKIQMSSMQTAEANWLGLVELLINGFFDRGADINGITYMQKAHSQGLKVWVSSSLDKALLDTVKVFLQVHLASEDHLNLKFCPHKYILQTLTTQKKSRGGRPSGAKLPSRRSSAKHASELADTALTGKPPAGLAAFCESYSDSGSINPLPSPRSVYSVSDNSSIGSGLSSKGNSFTSHAEGSPSYPNPRNTTPPLVRGVDQAMPFPYVMEAVTPLQRIQQKLSQRCPNAPLPYNPVAHYSAHTQFDG